MAGEARIKLSVDTSQAQQQIKIIDQQVNEIGSGAKIVDNIDTSSIGKLIEVQEKFISSVNEYVSQNQRNMQAILARMEETQASVRKSLSGDADKIYQEKLKELKAKEKMLNVGKGSSSSGSKSDKSSKDGSDKSQSTSGDLKSILGKLATGATITSAIKGLLSYTKSGQASSRNSEMQAYDVFNTLGLYNGRYDTARNVQADIGSPYGYDVYSTLGVQSKLIGRTGASQQHLISEDTMSALMTSRALSVDEGAFTNAFGSFYQTGTYGNGEVSKFANLFASSIQEAGMIGREDEQLEILESINSLLDKNLTTITESQYQSALGLYSLFSSSSQALSGSSSAGLVESLNTAITGGDNAMNIALGKYSGKFGSLWEFEKQKEKGVTDPENLASILRYFETYEGLDLNSDIGKYALQKFLATNGADLSTEEIQAIVGNKDKIMSGEYADLFGESVEGGTGTSWIEQLYQNYKDSKLEDMNMYQAESSNSQERIGDSANEVTSKLNALYNNMPQWMQNLVSGAGGAFGGVMSFGGGILSNYFGGKLIEKAGKGLFGKGAVATEGFTSYVDDLVDMVNGGQDVTEALGKLSKNGQVTDEMLDWLDSAVDAYNTGGDNIDDIINQGYKSFGKNFNKNSKIVSSADDVAKAVSGTDDVAKAVVGSADELAEGAGKFTKGLGKAGKILGAIGVALEVMSTAKDAGTAYSEEDYREVASEVGGGTGSILGGAGGAWGGGYLGGAIGTAIFPGVGTAVGTAVGTLLGGIGGGFAGDALGSSIGGALYDASGNKLSITKEQEEQIRQFYTNTYERYINEGNNSAQRYTLNTVVPYLRSIGVSASYTDRYNKDTGYPDFLKDYEDGLFDAGYGGSHTTKSGRHMGGGGRQFAIGLDYVPYDGFVAELHKGETILDAHTAGEYRRKGMNGSGGVTNVLEIKLSGAIDGMDQQNQNKITNTIIQQIKAYLGNTVIINQLANNSVRTSN